MLRQYIRILIDYVLLPIKNDPKFVLSAKEDILKLFDFGSHARDPDAEFYQLEKLLTHVFYGGDLKNGRVGVFDNANEQNFEKNIGDFPTKYQYLSGVLNARTINEFNPYNGPDVTNPDITKREYCDNYFKNSADMFYMSGILINRDDYILRRYSNLNDLNLSWNDTVLNISTNGKFMPLKFLIIRYIQLFESNLSRLIGTGGPGTGGPGGPPAAPVIVPVRPGTGTHHPAPRPPVRPVRHPAPSAPPAPRPPVRHPAPSAPPAPRSTSIPRKPLYTTPTVAPRSKSTSPIPMRTEPLLQKPRNLPKLKNNGPVPVGPKQRKAPLPKVSSLFITDIFWKLIRLVNKQITKLRTYTEGGDPLEEAIKTRVRDKEPIIIKFLKKHQYSLIGLSLETKQLKQGEDSPFHDLGDLFTRICAISKTPERMEKLKTFMIDLHDTLKQTFTVEDFTEEESPREIYNILKKDAICDGKPLLGMAPKKGILGLKYDNDTDSIVRAKVGGSSEDLIDLEDSLTIDFDSLE
jgi:hypothetical protein